MRFDAVGLFKSATTSAPCRYAYHDVTVRADVGRVQVFFRDRPIAEHKRCHEREKANREMEALRRFAPELPLIEAKPRALD